MRANFLIPAGGLGQRLRPLTDETPKPLLPVAARDDGSMERIIDTPVSIGRALGSSVIVAGFHKSEQLDTHFSDAKDITVVRDTGIVHIGGSMLQHRTELFAGQPDCIAMIPGDHYIAPETVARMLGTLSSAHADIVMLGTWEKSYHETYPVSATSGHLELDRHNAHPDKIISALGSYILDAAWLADRLDTVPVGPDGHCDLTTDIVFGADQTEPPRIVFEPLQSGEPWQDVGTIQRLFAHIRAIHDESAFDSRGNINLSGEPLKRSVTQSVVYFDADEYPDELHGCFIAKNIVEPCL